MNNQLQLRQTPMNELHLAGTAIANSGFFGIKTPEEFMALAMIAESEGRHFAVAARDYHIIQGKPSLRADTMLSRFQESGGMVKWLSYTDKMVTGTFSHPKAGELTVEWTWEMAVAAELTEKKNRDGSKNNWQKYPRAMLRSRVISEAIRTLYPACLGGMYTDEEVESFADNNTPKSNANTPLLIKISRLPLL